MKGGQLRNRQPSLARQANLKGSTLANNNVQLVAAWFPIYVLMTC